jgi:hypothetical protein
VRIEVLTHAKEDLFDGYLFYERQEAGIGDYFLDSLSADIESLLLHHGYHRRFYGFHRMIARVFPFSSITASRMRRFTSMPWWIKEGIQPQSNGCSIV